MLTDYANASGNCPWGYVAFVRGHLTLGSEALCATKGEGTYGQGSKKQPARSHWQVSGCHAVGQSLSSPVSLCMPAGLPPRLPPQRLRSLRGSHFLFSSPFGLEAWGPLCAPSTSDCCHSSLGPDPRLLGGTHLYLLQQGLVSPSGCSYKKGSRERPG